MTKKYLGSALTFPKLNLSGKDYEVYAYIKQGIREIFNELNAQVTKYPKPNEFKHLVITYLEKYRTDKDYQTKPCDKLVNEFELALLTHSFVKTTPHKLSTKQNQKIYDDTRKMYDKLIKS